MGKTLSEKQVNEKRKPDWSRCLPRPLVIPNVMTLAKLADVRESMRHLAEDRAAAIAAVLAGRTIALVRQLRKLPRGTFAAPFVFGEGHIELAVERRGPYRHAGGLRRICFALMSAVFPGEGAMGQPLGYARSAIPREERT